MADPTITSNTPGTVQPGSLIQAATQSPSPGQITSVQNQITPTPTTPVAGVSAAQATAAPATSQNYSPAGVVVADDQTVQGELSKIIDNNSPLMQQAQTRANQEANERGLLDSSLAVQSGQAAVTAQALPIAQQDAATKFAANQQTVANEQAAAAANAQAANTANLQNSSLETQTSQQNAGMINAAMGNTAQAINTQNLSYLDKNTQMQLAQLGSNTQLQVTNIQAANQELLQTNSSASSMFNAVVNNLAAISADATLSPSAKQTATDSQLNMLQEAMKQLSTVASTPTSAVSSLNLGSFFGSTMNSPANMTPQQQQVQLSQLQLAVNDAQAALPVWGQNQEVYVAPPGPMQSERTAENFNNLYASKLQELQQAQQALKDFQSQLNSLQQSPAGTA